MCDLIPLSVLALDFDPPVAGWGPLFEAEGVEQVEDDIGRAAISRNDAARLFGARRAAYAFAEDQRRRREAEMAAAAVPVLRGVPSHPDLGPIEAMLAADEANRPKSVFEKLLDAELAHGKGT
jgi:hypothetical protein